MPTLTLTLPKPHKGQQVVMNSPARFTVLACGRRFGKTTLGIDRLVEKVLRGKPTAYFAPTYKMLSEVWRESIVILQPIIKRLNVQEKRIELVTGGSVDFWSLDTPDVARGRKYARVVIDEAAMIAKLGEAWQAVIRPTLTDLEGDAYFFSTPKGNNFFKQVFDWGQDRLAHPDWVSWQMPTISNPHINPNEIEAARLELPERIYQQEYLAMFLQDAGGVFRGVSAIATGLIYPERYSSRFVAGLDWGKQNDFTVISVFDSQSRKMVDLDRFNKIDWAFQRERVKTVCNKWELENILAERNSIGDPNIEALQREGLPVTGFDMTSVSKSPLIESWSLAIERKETELLNDPTLVAEHESYERRVSSVTGRSSYSAPEGFHDDTVIASALGWKAVIDNGAIELDSDSLSILTRGFTNL